MNTQIDANKEVSFYIKSLKDNWDYDHASFGFPTHERFADYLKQNPNKIVGVTELTATWRHWGCDRPGDYEDCRKAILNVLKPDLWTDDQIVEKAISTNKIGIKVQHLMAGLDAGGNPYDVQNFIDKVIDKLLSSEEIDLQTAFADANKKRFDDDCLLAKLFYFFTHSPVGQGDQQLQNILLQTPRFAGNQESVDKAIAVINSKKPVNLYTPPKKSEKSVLPVADENSVAWPVPDGYLVIEGKLFTSREVFTSSGPITVRDKLIYPGQIRVTGVDQNMDTQPPALNLTVEFPGQFGKPITITAPAAELATKRGCIEHLTSAGAAIEEKNAAELASYLIKSFDIQRHNLDPKRFTHRLGLSNGGLITPLKNINTGVEYRGNVTAVGKDESIYKQAIAEIIGWGDKAWPVWLSLGASLISPLTKKLEFRRNPVLVMVGQSNSGKTTVCQFATGIWGDPCGMPFRIDGATANTRKGIEMTQEGLGGLPWLYDEVHKIRPERLEEVFYGQANQQARVIGQIDGTSRGGQSVSGTLFCAGEGLPGLNNKGASNRALIINVDDHPPLGISGNGRDGHISQEGKARARVLERAFNTGYGHIGPAVYQAIMENWTEFDGLMQKFQEGLDLDHWNAPISAMQAALLVLFRVVGVTPSLGLVEGLSGHVGRDILDSYRSGEHDPVIKNFENVLGMIHGLRMDDDEKGAVYGTASERNVAWKVTDGDGRECIVVSTASRAFKESIDGQISVSSLANQWFNQGKIVKKLMPLRTPAGSPITTVKAIMIDLSMTTMTTVSENDSSPIEACKHAMTTMTTMTTIENTPHAHVEEITSPGEEDFSSPAEKNSHALKREESGSSGSLVVKTPNPAPTLGHDAYHPDYTGGSSSGSGGSHAKHALQVQQVIDIAEYWDKVILSTDEIRDLLDACDDPTTAVSLLHEARSQWERGTTAKVGEFKWLAELGKAIYAVTRLRSDVLRGDEIIGQAVYKAS